jgi:hypothetical protein
MKYNLVTVVWGKEYTEFFAEVVIPNLLTPGNLDALSRTSGPVFRLFTRPQDARAIKGSPVFERVSKFITVEFNEISETDFSQNYLIVSKYHKKAIDAANKDKASIIIIGPDTIRAEGYMANLIRIAESGKRAVMVSDVRVAKDTFLPEYMKGFFENGILGGIKPRELAKLALEHLHPVSKSFLWSAKQFHNAPSLIYFEVPGEGILARCFHLIPVLVNPLGKDACFSTTFDNDYIANVCPDMQDIYVSIDSDELMSVELSSLSYPSNAGKRPPSPLNIAAFAKYSTCAHNRFFFREKIRFHCEDISSRWEKTEEISDKAVAKIFYWLKFEPFLFWPYGISLKAKGFIRNIIKFLIGESSTRKLVGWVRSISTRISL